MERFSHAVSDILSESRFIESNELVRVRVVRSSQAMGMVLQLSQVSSKGNRFKRKLTWPEFLEASFGNFNKNASLAEHLHVGKSTVRNMQVMVGSAYMNQQANLLAKLAQWSLTQSPALVLKHVKWDETQLQCSMNADKSSSRVRSCWQVLVCRIRLVVVWPNGENLVLRIVMPPVTLLATGAEHQYYALNYHPAYKCINGLLALLRSRSLVNIDVAETDGASSNLRLLAFLVQKAKTTLLGPPGLLRPLLIAYARCMNHAVQLNNAALLAAASPTLLNKMYGLTVFLRNLGYWLRLRQAARAWLDRTLVFRRQMTADDVRVHPALQELIEYLRVWNKLDKQARHVEEEAPQSTSEDRFDAKAAAFLDMFNGDISGPPCHICRDGHCQDRADAVRKATDALLNLLLHSLPAVPSPSKWAKLFGPLDFCLCGSLVHNWLHEVFSEAFGEMKFQEFDDSGKDVDPRLVESLAFHAVNGRRLRCSKEFLTDRHSKWAVSLVSVALEPNRVLTWYWIGCLKKSLVPGSRPPLFSLLHPRESVLTSMLQHYTSLLCTRTGCGRMSLLWMPLGFDSFDAFCQAEPQLVREIRRTLLLACGWQHRRHHEYINSDMYAVAMVADPQACPETLRSFLHRWEKKQVCCVPPGLPRALKVQKVSSEDLQGPAWKQVMYWYAASFQWSIADVEVKHAFNRQNSECGFSTIAAKFINKEALLNLRQAAAATTKASLPDKISASLAGDRDVSVLDKRVAKAKGKSAFEIFRGRWISQQRLTSDGAFNPCSRAAWNAARQAWSEMPQEQRAVCESLAAASKESARRKRAQSRPPRKPDSAAARTSQQLQLPHPTQDAATPSLVASLPLERAVASKSVSELCCQIHAANSKVLDCRRLGKHSFPVSERMLEDISSSQRRKGISTAAAVNQFDCEMERMARPPDDCAFPKKVQYESACGCQCRNNGDTHRQPTLFGFDSVVVTFRSFLS